MAMAGVVGLRDQVCFTMRVVGNGLRHVEGFEFQVRLMVSEDKAICPWRDVCVHPQLAPAMS